MFKEKLGGLVPVPKTPFWVTADKPLLPQLKSTRLSSDSGARGTRQRKCTTSLNWLFTICRRGELQNVDNFEQSKESTASKEYVLSIDLSGRL